MTTSRFVIFSAVAVLLCAVTISEGIRVSPQRCCFSYTDRPLPIKAVVDYIMTSQQCLKEAVLFKTVRGRQVCAKPTDSWVQKHMEAIDRKRIGGQGTL